MGFFRRVVRWCSYTHATVLQPVLSTLSTLSNNFKGLCHRCTHTSWLVETHRNPQLYHVACYYVLIFKCSPCFSPCSSHSGQACCFPIDQKKLFLWNIKRGKVNKTFLSQQTILILCTYRELLLPSHSVSPHYPEILSIQITISIFL